MRIALALALLASLGACSGSAPSLPAQVPGGGTAWARGPRMDSANERILYNFIGGGQGAHPFGSLAADGHGSYYATTYDGGSTCGQFVCGTVVRLTPRRRRSPESVVYRFRNNGDGYSASAGLIVDQSGTIYGTSPCCYTGQNGNGVFFKLTPSGSGYTFTTLYAFTGNGPYPNSGLIAGNNGDFFGTAFQGGSAGQGAVFELKPQGSGYAEIALYSFKGGRDGINPAVGLTAGTSGKLYGTTAFGGSTSIACNQGFGCGTVFELIPKTHGYSEHVLYRFAAGNDGNEPFAALVRDAKGDLFGTTLYGGGAPSCPDGCGTVFKLHPSPHGFQESVLYNFPGDADYPSEPVIEDKAGTLYSATAQGGSFNGGVVFKLSPAASGYTETDLHIFGGLHDGESPNALTFDKAGALLGTTYFGGSTPPSQCGNSAGCGIVFSIRGAK